METVTDPALQNIPTALRNLQPTAFHHSLSSQLAPDYDPTAFQSYGINEVPQVNGQVQNYSQTQQNLQTPLRYPNGSFNAITPEQQQSRQVPFQTNGQDDSSAKEAGGHFGGMKAIENPPDLDRWRNKLFNVNEMITLTEDE
jgi:hypothetical protein